jgi:hypothetical protein
MEWEFETMVRWRSSLCVDIARFLPSRHVPDKRTMQANRDRFERTQLLQVYGEPDYDSPLLSASKTDQKRKSSPTTTNDRSDKKRVKSTKKTSPASKSRKIIPNHYKADNVKGSSPTTNLLAKKEKTPPYSRPNPSIPANKHPRV